MSRENAPEPVRYMKRTRDYYAAQGFSPYVWAHRKDVPFQPLAKPLEASTATIIITANEPSPEGWQPGERRPPRRVHEIDSLAPPSAFYTDDLSWHKGATHTDDLGSYFPLAVLRQRVAEGRLGGVAPRCHGIPTEYSHRATEERDAPLILERCLEDGVDVAFLVPL
jgi:hypothetical protein